MTVLADAYRGNAAELPNDVVVKSDETIWFSDPPYGINTDYEGGKREALLPANLYRFDPRDGSLTVVADDFEGPNGLAFSPDERLLYVAETGASSTRARAVHPRLRCLGRRGAARQGAGVP